MSDGAQQVTEVVAASVTYADAIRIAMGTAMAADERVVLIGEGVPDPKAIFGTTAGLREQFGDRRVFDMPLSENGVTGICIGAALTGLRPVMVHQRIDFLLLAMDQLVNNAAKWRYMFNGQCGIPLVVRAIVGRGWGQGPQHSQALHALFSHIPGLRVVLPATAEDAGGMLLSAIACDDPVIIVEHRWLHHTRGRVGESPEPRPLTGARVLRTGTDITIAAFSHMVVEGLRTADWLTSQGLSVELLDMRVSNPLDIDAVVESVRRTGRLLVADIGCAKGGIANDLVAAVVQQAFTDLEVAPVVVALPDHPLPTSHHLADDCYPDAADIARSALALCGMPDQLQQQCESLRRATPRDQPDRDFVGPF